MIEASAVSGPGQACPPPPEIPVFEPLIRSREEHNISRRDIDPDALRVLYRLARNGHTAYLVGGGVRDLLLGRKPKDFDISTDARPEQIRALFKNCILIGRRFRLAHIRYGDKIIETSTFRSAPAAVSDPADPDADLFQRDDNLFGTPREDALRRDFTVNGLFYDIGSFRIIDYVGGLEDLGERRIRAIGVPGVRFREDPVRMIRAVRFASRLNFGISPGTEDAIRGHGRELIKASPARLLEEIQRLFAFASGERAMRLLDSTGLLEVILPEVSACLAREAGENPAAAFWERLRILDRGDTVMPDATPALIFSVLLVEPLKNHLARNWESGHFPRLKFDKILSFLQPLAQRLRFPKKLADRIAHIFLSQNRFFHPEAKPGSLAGFVTQDSFHESLALAEILAGRQPESQELLNPWRDMLNERIYSLEGISGRRPPPRGHPVPGEAGGSPFGGPEGAAAGESGEKPGKSVSRSARRRRNKRLRRQHAITASPPEGRPEESGPPAQAEAIPPARPEVRPPKTEAAEPEPAGAPAPLPEAPIRSAAGEAPPAGESRRRRRGGSRRKAEAAGRPAEPANREKPAAGPPADHPLTASSFYFPESPAGESRPEPEREKGRGGARKRGGKPARSRPGPGMEPAAGEAPEDQPPFRRDRLDDADVSPHWLDEI
jgi:poly(A) polymerase